MNIGLDVDGVLVDVRTFQLREGKRYFEKKFGISIKIRTCLKCRMFSNVRRNRGRRSGLNTFGSIA